MEIYALRVCYLLNSKDEDPIQGNWTCHKRESKFSHKIIWRNCNYLDLLLEVTCSACDWTCVKFLFFLLVFFFCWRMFHSHCFIHIQLKFLIDSSQRKSSCSLEIPPNCKLFTLNVDIHMYDCQYWTLYIGLKRTTFGQSIWDKVRSYWEHVGEHIESSENMLRMQWELGGNALGTKNSNTQHPPQKRKNWVYWVYVVIYHWLIKIL